MRRGFYRSPKQLKLGTFDGGVSDSGTAETAQFRAMGIISGINRYPKDVPFVRGTYDLGL